MMSDVNNILYFNSIEEYVKLKIQRNKAMLDCLNIKNNIIKKEILFNHKDMLINNEKILIINKINEIEEKQTRRFMEEYEQILVEKYNQVNNLKVENVNILKEEIINLHQEYIKKVNEVLELNNKIPTKLDYINIGYMLDKPLPLE